MVTHSSMILTLTANHTEYHWREKCFKFTVWVIKGREQILLFTSASLILLSSFEYSKSMIKQSKSVHTLSLYMKIANRRYVFDLYGMFIKWRVSIWGIYKHPFIIAYIGDKQVEWTVKGVGETAQGSGKQGIKKIKHFMCTVTVWNMHGYVVAVGRGEEDGIRQS